MQPLITECESSEIRRLLKIHKPLLADEINQTIREIKARLREASAVDLLAMSSDIEMLSCCVDLDEGMQPGEMTSRSTEYLQSLFLTQKDYLPPHDGIEKCILHSEILSMVDNLDDLLREYVACWAAGLSEHYFRPIFQAQHRFRKKTSTSKPGNFE